MEVRIDLKRKFVARMIEMLEAGFCGECTHALETETMDGAEVDYCYFCEHSVEPDGTTVSRRFSR